MLFGTLSDAPVMVGMKWYGVGHWVVMIHSDSEYVTILDPNRPSLGRFNRRISRSGFFDEWDGAAVAISDH
jgi:predicted double-glycine peptidase